MRAPIHAAATLALGAWLGTSLVAVGISQPAQPGTVQTELGRADNVKPMSDDRFWSLIAATMAYERDSDRQIAALHSGLARLSVEDIEAFEASFQLQLQRSYSWDLWGAAYVVNGGASDDGFEYFRCWLISKGRRTFEKVLADPDSLADLLAPKVEGDLEFEAFAYVARQAWSEKVGRPGEEMPSAPMLYSREPSGTKFEENAADLAKRYPKLWRRFGSNPHQ